MKKNNYINKDVFYNMSEPFFEEGLLKEIYSSDNISICNVSNAFYLVFNYTITNNGPIGVGLEAKYIKALIENDNLFYELYNVIGEKKFKESCVSLNKQTYDYLKKVKKETDLKGAYIDLDYENSIIGNLKNR